MKITRRTLLGTGSAGLLTAGLGPILPTRAWANARLEADGRSLDTLSDGNLVLPMGFLTAEGVDAAALRPILEKHGVTGDSYTPDCNVTLLRDGDRVVLFDVGSGPDFMPSAGKLTEALDAVDLTPDDVTHVVFTHAHPDHLWGLLDEFDDPIFPEASYMIGRSEWDYWIDPETVDTIGEARASFAVGAQRRLEAVEDRIEFFDDGAEILPGVAARATFGHTPGHMAFEVALGGESAMIVGDAIGNHHIAFERPEIASGADQDAEKGIATRVALLDQIAAAKMPMIGFHLPTPGIGRAEKTDDGYRFVAVE
ncbi:MBL fold metallo-hydrolase [Brevirhabdus pacifica]|uniref:MBL fold metallo-hydrolase n=1 Tax=Brevirhabdus pacifica TaxID=1267768 RepID=A0A1U7DGS5_9RHOB|nr:MBL fold metallo-hydrolase [Brevirhabdus pacifica]APX89093.1 MBL fold metallo-hydrolase [Brevirhabdus pacifica]OWU76846.1 metallo-beta-lactamase [Loktanella sp. 22II-4b]PJJ86325.1 glyoxylase-like metal-dependent hydrolase (beta-lactamase superfamily II) [Brevirhabdus pacifica]